MIYKEKEITGELYHFIKCFWMSDSEEQEGISTVLPDGYFDLIFKWIGRDLVSVSLTGTWTVPVDVPYTRHTRFFGIRFKLIASEYIFCESIEKIVDTSTDLPFDYWDTSEATFASFENFTHVMSRIIENYLPDNDVVDRRKIRLMDMLYELHGNITVNELAGRVGWSSRQINRWFNNQFGLSLKVFANILKCHAAYGDIAEGRLHPAKAYYDQAHFIKAVKRYTGVTPKELHKNENDRFLQLLTRIKR